MRSDGLGDGDDGDRDRVSRSSEAEPCLETRQSLTRREYFERKLGPSHDAPADFSAGTMGMNEGPYLRPERRARRQLASRDYSPFLQRFTQALSAANQVLL